MHIVGFDVAKDELVGVRSNRSAEEKERFTVKNTASAIHDCLSRLQQRFKRFEVVCESTGSYHYELVRQCTNLNVPLRLLNPIMTKQFTRATVRQTKTDQSDALVIAKLGLQKQGRYVTEADLNETKTLARTARTCQQLAGGLTATHAHLKQVTSQSHHSVLEAITRLKETELELRTEAINSTDPTTLNLLTTIPGVGEWLATVIMAEVGTVERFTDSASLVAFTGLDPKVRQSGTTLNRHTRLSKRGPSHLRWALFLAAGVARQHDEEMKMFYEKKRNEGRSYTEATVACARKLTRRLYAVWSNRTPYEPQNT